MGVDGGQRGRESWESPQWKPVTAEEEEKRHPRWSTRRGQVHREWYLEETGLTGLSRGT